MAKANARVQHRARLRQGNLVVEWSPSLARKCAKEIHAAKGGGFLTRTGETTAGAPNQSNLQERESGRGQSWRSAHFPDSVFA
jgi:hypothetical protein